MSNKYLEYLPEETIEDLQGMVRDLRDFKPNGSTEEWASDCGRYYVMLYGRPSSWDSYDTIGASLIYYFSYMQKTLNNYPSPKNIQNIPCAIAYWNRRLKWWQDILNCKRQEGREIQFELRAIAKCHEILEKL